MLSHFKLNCFIFVMLVGQINLGEKVSRNIDAFFDPAVDDLQDNFYDIPFIPEQNAQQTPHDDELSEHDVFQFGRDKLLSDFKEDFEEIKRLYELKNEISKRDSKQTLNNDSSNGLLESVVNKFNQIGKKKNNLYIRMQNIEHDEAILERGHKNYQMNKRIKLEDVPTPKRHKFINSVYFSHKYRHKRPIRLDYDAPQIDKRTCNKEPKPPHKHRAMNTPFHSNKHEQFKDELSQTEECYVLKTPEVDESNCNKTMKVTQEEPTKETTTKKKHKQLAAKVTKPPTTKETCNKTKPTNASPNPKRTDVTKHQIEPMATKSSIPPTKPSIKSVLCHKMPKTPTTTSQNPKFEEYEDYKAGDYVETEFRVKRNKKRSGCDKNKDDDENKSDGGDKDLIDEFLKGETTESHKAQPFHSPPAASTKIHKEDAIEQFLKRETTKSGRTTKMADLRRHLQEEQVEGQSEASTEEEKKISVSKIDQFVNEETPRTTSNGGMALRKHKQFNINEEVRPKKVESKNDFALKRTAYLTPIFNKERIQRKKMKELLDQHYFTTEKNTFKQFFEDTSSETPDVFDSSPDKSPKQQVYVLKPNNEEHRTDEEEEGDEPAKEPKKFKQKLFIVKPKKKHNQNFENVNKLEVLENPENSEQSQERQIIEYLKEIIKNQRQHNINGNKQIENVVNIKEMNRKLGHESEKRPSPKTYVAHLKNQGRQHHRIYSEQRKPKQKQKTQTFGRKTMRDSELNRYESFLERLKKHQTESEEQPEPEENIDEESTETPETTTEMEDNPEIDELYNEIPVNKNRIQLSLNCDSTDYKNKDHCICSVKTMLRDLMDDLKDINTSMSYQYDCSKYIGIEPGIVIANDSREMRGKRHIFNDNFMLRKGSRIGRDVDGLLNQHLNVDDSDNYIYATVGSKVVMNCGNTSTDYNEDDKIVWTIMHGAPETAGVKEDNGRELIIERVSAQDTNNYTCTISHKLQDGSYGPSKRFLHKLSIVEIPIYSLMISVIFNESAKCEHEDLETLHNYYPLMLKKFLCQGAEQICQVSVDKPHCSRSHSENGVTMRATLKTLPLYSVLPSLKNKQETCGINCQSRVYSIIVKTLQNNFASVTNLPVFFRDNKEHKKFLPIQYELGDKSNMFSNSILTICPQGFGIFQRNEKLCLACEPHTYNPGNKKNCIECPSGSYQPIYGAASCLPCTSPLDDTRCFFGSKAELTPKLFFIIPIILALVVIIIIIYCIFASTRKRKTDETNGYYMSGENVQTKVIEQIFTGDTSEKSYSTATQRLKRTSEKTRQKSKPEPPPVDFN